jgi:hypothetical protein
MSHTDNLIIDEANANLMFETAADDLLQDQEENLLLIDMTNTDLVEKLIKTKAMAQKYAQLESDIKDELMSRSDFSKIDYQGIIVEVRQTKRVSFTKAADMKSLREKYPNIVSKKDVLNPGGISEEVLEYIKEENPEAFREEFEADAKLIHQIEPGKFTEQKVSTAVYVTGMGKAV